VTILLLLFSKLKSLPMFAKIVIAITILVSLASCMMFAKITILKRWAQTEIQDVAEGLGWVGGFSGGTCSCSVD